MKLLVLANSGVFGGAEVFLIRLCRELLARGVAVVAVCPPGGELERRFRQLSIESVYGLDMGAAAGRRKGSGSFLLQLPSSKRRMRKLLEQMQAAHGCDTVLCQYPREQYLTALLSETCGYRSVWMFHSQLFFFIHRLYVNPLLIRVIRKAHAAFAFSASTKKIMVSQGYPADALCAIPEGMDPPAGVGTAREDRAAPRIGIVSRMHYLKGVQDTISALPGVIREFPNLEVLIAGTGPYKGKLERLVRELRLEDSVRFLGFVSDPTAVYSKIDVLIHVPFDPGDSMPIAILEAAANGVPALASRWAGIEEMVIDGKTGILVPPRDQISIEHALKRMLADRENTAKMGEEARKHVLSHFTMSQITELILAKLQGSRDINRSSQLQEPVPVSSFI